MICGLISILSLGSGILYSGIPSMQRIKLFRPLGQNSGGDNIQIGIQFCAWVLSRSKMIGIRRSEEWPYATVRKSLQSTSRGDFVIRCRSSGLDSMQSSWRYCGVHTTKMFSASRMHLSLQPSIPPYLLISFLE